MHQYLLASSHFSHQDWGEKSRRLCTHGAVQTSRVDLLMGERTYISSNVRNICKCPRDNACESEYVCACRFKSELKLRLKGSLDKEEALSPLWTSKMEKNETKREGKKDESVMSVQLFSK